MGTIPTITTFVAGTELTAAMLNEVKAASDFWALTPRCYAYASGAQSLASGVYTAIAFDSEIYDIVQSGDSPSHDAATNNTRLYVRTSGKYEITGQVYFATNATGSRSADLRLNAAGNPAGGTRIALNQQTALSGVGSPATAPVIEYPLVTGDYVEIFGMQNSGGALNTAGGSGLTLLRMKLTGS
jgi:hypothetical protein